MRILIAEDTQAIRLSLEGMLQKAKPAYQIVSVANGMAALAALYREAFDLMLTDDNMPGMRGMELIQKIRPAFPDMAIILMSARDVIEVRAEVQQRQLRVDGFLGKPFTPVQLTQMIESVSKPWPTM